MSGYLVDTSVLLRYRRKTPAVVEAMNRLDPHRVLYRCSIVEMEIIYATPGGRSDEARTMLRAGYATVPMTPEVHNRATDVQLELARAGRHKGISLSDLLIAACAEINNDTVLHYDSDFDTIADVTGQDAEWVVDKGSVP